MRADEARQISIKNKNAIEEYEFEALVDKIRKFASYGQRSINMIYVSDHNAEKLRHLGYKVEQTQNTVAKSKYRDISW